MGYFDWLIGKPKDGEKGHESTSIRPVSQHTTKGAGFRDVDGADIRADANSAGRDQRITENVHNTGGKSTSNSSANHISNNTIYFGSEFNQSLGRRYSNEDIRVQPRAEHERSSFQSPNSEEVLGGILLENQELKWQLEDCGAEKKKQKRELKELNYKIRRQQDEIREHGAEKKRLKERIEEHEVKIRSLEDIIEGQKRMIDDFKEEQAEQAEHKRQESRSEYHRQIMIRSTSPLGHSPSGQLGIRHVLEFRRVDMDSEFSQVPRR